MVAIKLFSGGIGQWRAGVNKVILVGNLGADPGNRSMPEVGMTVSRTSESPPASRGKTRPPGAQAGEGAPELAQHRAGSGRLGRNPPQNTCARVRRCSSRANCATRKMAKISREMIGFTTERSSPTICKCWAGPWAGGAGANERRRRARHGESAAAGRRRDDYDQFFGAAGARGRKKRTSTTICPLLAPRRRWPFYGKLLGCRGGAGPLLARR